MDAGRCSQCSLAVLHKAALQLLGVLAAAIRQGKVLSMGHGHETKTTSSLFRKLSSIHERKEMKWN